MIKEASTKIVSIHIRIPLYQLNRLEKKAIKHNTTLSHQVRHIFEQIK